ncbi:MAG: HD domain-containing protein [Actinomycetota bacterium]
MKAFEQKIKNRVEEYFKQYPQHIEHTRKVLEYAKKILKTEHGDREVVIASALLHDIGLLESKRKYGSYEAKYQQMEGPPVARNILEEVGTGKELISQVCDIIANHHRRGVIESNEFNILWDADWLVNFGTNYQDSALEERKALIERIFVTDTGKEIAEKIYL